MQRVPSGILGSVLGAILAASVAGCGPGTSPPPSCVSALDCPQGMVCRENAMCGPPPDIDAGRADAHVTTDGGDGSALTDASDALGLVDAVGLPDMGVSADAAGDATVPDDTGPSPLETGVEIDAATLVDTGSFDAAIFDAFVEPVDAAVGGSDTGRDAFARDAFAPDASLACHPSAPACTSTQSSIAPGPWVAYWDADDAAEIAPTSGPSGPQYMGVRRWRSRVGNAGLEFPADLSALFPDPFTPPLFPPSYGLASWGRGFANGVCRLSGCLPALNLARGPATAPAGQGAFLITQNPSVLISAMTPALTVVMQLSIAPDPDNRTSTLFSFGGPTGSTFPYLRGYLSGTTLRLQSQDTTTSPVRRVDFGGAIARDTELFVAFVVDPASTSPVRLFRADGAGSIQEQTAVIGTNQVYFPFASARLAIGALARRIVADPLDGRVRRFAVAHSALNPTQVADTLAAWRAADTALVGQPATTYMSAVATDGPIAWMRMGTGLVGNATPFGATWVGDPSLRTAQACGVDYRVQAGLGTYLEVPDADAYSIPTSGSGLTVETWVRFDDPNPLGEIGPSGNKDYLHFLGKGESLNHEWAFRAYRDDSTVRPGRLSFYSWEPSGGIAPGQYLNPTCERQMGRWVHIVGVADHPTDASSGLHIWVNGSPGQGTANLYGSNIPMNGNAPLRLGIRTPPPGTSIGGFHVGALADFAIYPRGLTQAEIQAHYAAAAGLRY